MKASQLRDLTRKYAAGAIGRDEYLAERARLINAVVAGEIELRYRELEPPTARRDDAGRQKHWLLMGGSVMLVGLLLVALLAYFFDPAPPADSDSAAKIASVQQNPGSVRLEQFMATGDWSEAALDQLEDDWRRLSAFHRENTRRSAAYRRLKHETSQRISEQEALLAAGEMDALLQATRLREFAERLGLKTEP